MEMTNTTKATPANDTKVPTTPRVFVSNETKPADHGALVEPIAKATAKAIAKAPTAKAKATETPAKAKAPTKVVDLGAVDANGVYTTKPTMAVFDARLRAYGVAITPLHIAKALGRVQWTIKGSPCRSILRDANLSGSWSTHHEKNANWSFQPGTADWTTMLGVYAKAGCTLA